MSTSAPTSTLQDCSGRPLPEHTSGGDMAPTALLLGFFTVMVDAMVVPSSPAVLREAFPGPAARARAIVPHQNPGTTTATDAGPRLLGR
ncbi:hypothetical protein [Streptomyces sp. NBC_00258]|uniref:hypothetical protein n=1 Tax=Streptomyces sp. NBC_00258 TaxID=2903642 RepID=UPI002E2AFAAB|nr:hypothetical protein [Streptomyces sp. NBC_00258]